MDYQKRLKNLQSLFHELGCDSLIVDDAINLYYLTGLQMSAGQLVVHATGADLLVDGRYYELCKKSSPFPVTLTQGGPSGIKTLLTHKCTFIRALGFNSDTTSYQSYLDLQKDLPVTLKPVNNPVKRLRIIKEDEEIKLLRNAAKLGTEGYEFVRSHLREGIAESELATELEIFWKKRGSKGVAFEPIIAFGPNSAMPHYRAGAATLKKGDVVLIDIGVNLQHYHSDMTRIVHFGEPNPKILEIQKIVEQAKKAALKLCMPGMLIGDLDAAARDIITAKGYGENFTHSLGHGVGLEIHELPVIRNADPYKNMPLEAGMVITIEPGIYLPGIGGVRLEDTIVITSTGHENLQEQG